MLPTGDGSACPRGRRPGIAWSQVWDTTIVIAIVAAASRWRLMQARGPPVGSDALRLGHGRQVLLGARGGERLQRWRRAASRAGSARSFRLVTTTRWPPGSRART